MLEKIWNLARACIYGAVFIALQTWFFPRWAGISGSLEAPLREPLRTIGAIPLIVGAPIMLYCIWNFAYEGRGTPAPFDPPRRLVVSGLYKYVRNPMYMGMGLALIGEAILFAKLNMRLAIYAAVLILIVNLFVRFYEEPKLKKNFPENYGAYAAKVPRWIPKFG